MGNPLWIYFHFMVNLPASDSIIPEPRTSGGGYQWGYQYHIGCTVTNLTNWWNKKQPRGIPLPPRGDPPFLVSNQKRWCTLSFVVACHVWSRKSEMLFAMCNCKTAVVQPMGIGWMLVSTQQFLRMTFLCNQLVFFVVCHLVFNIKKLHKSPSAETRPESYGQSIHLTLFPLSTIFNPTKISKHKKKHNTIVGGFKFVWKNIVRQIGNLPQFPGWKQRKTHWNHHLEHQPPSCDSQHLAALCTDSS